MSMHQHRSTNGRRMARALAAAALIVGACSIAAIVATRRRADTSSPPIALTVASDEVSLSMRGAILNTLRDELHRRLDVDISVRDTNNVVIQYGDGAPDNLTEEDCPAGQCRHSPDGLCVGRVECSADPCEMNPCEGEDLCVAEYCGGCFAVCFPPTKQDIMLDGDIQRRAEAVIVESSSDVFKRNSGLRHCSEYSRKKCKQSAVCQWDGTANLCVYLLSAGVGSSDLSCNLKSSKQCRKDPDCELWGPNMDICVTKPHEGVLGDGGGEPVKFVSSLDPCADKTANKCKKDRKCKWRKEKCIGKSSNTNKFSALATRSGWTAEESDMDIIAMGKDPDVLNNDMHQGSCIADFQCEGDLVCHAASGECICNTLNNEGCALGEKCGVPPGLECLPPGCLPMCTCDYTSNTIDGSNGCPVGEVCREPCAMADGRPRCFESDAKRDCAIYDVGGSDYMCRDSNGDGMIDGNDGGMGCVIRAELVGRAPEMGVTSMSVSSSTIPRLDPVHQPNLDDLLNDIDSVPLTEQDPLLSSVADSESDNDPMVPFSDLVATNVPKKATLPVFKIVTEATHSSEVFSHVDTSRPEKYWPRSADVPTRNGIHDCVKSSEYPLSYLDMHVNQKEVVLFDTREECCRSYHCADDDARTVGDDSPTNSTLAKPSYPQHGPSRPEKYWPMPAHQATINGIHDCVKSSDYPLSYLELHVNLQIEILFDTREECCSSYPCAHVDWTMVEHSPSAMPKNPMDLPIDELLDYWLAVVPEELLDELVDVADPLSLIMSVHCSLATWHVSSFVDNTCTNGEINPVLAALYGVTFYGSALDCCGDEFVGDRCEVLDSCQVSLSFDRDSTSVSSPIVPQADLDQADVDTTAGATSSLAVLPVVDTTPTTLDAPIVEDYWYPNLVDGVGDCIYGSGYPELYTMDDLHRESFLFESHQNCCALFPAVCI